MNTVAEFIAGNPRIEITGNNGAPIAVPAAWRPALTDSDALVVIPDLHMYAYNSPLDNFHWGAQALLDLLAHCESVRDTMEDAGQSLRVVQIGDMYEMRFPSPVDQTRNATTDDILASHPSYDLIANRLRSLDAEYIYGNHDYEMRHFDNAAFALTDGRVYLEHGFAPAPWSEDPRKPHWDVAMMGLRVAREVELDLIELGLSNLALDIHYGTGVAIGSVERKALPDAATYLRDYGIQHEYYSKRIVNRVDAPSGGGPEPRIAIIGHTHNPYVDVNPGNDNAGYIYIDAGGWTEGRSDFVVVTSDEIALCHFDRALDSHSTV